jgi:filamentous hemagglutinin
LYANASPAVFVDPTGEQACLGQALLNCPLDQFVPNNRAIPQNISSNAIQGLPETFAVFEDRIPAGIISLPPNHQIFTENYRLVPEVNPDEPEATLFYTAFRLDTNAPEFAIPPSQLDTFVAHSEKFLNIAALNDTLRGNSPSHIRSQRLFNAVLNQAGRVQDNRSINEELTQANSELLRDPAALFDLATGFVGAGPARSLARNSSTQGRVLFNIGDSQRARQSNNFEIHREIDRKINSRNSTSGGRANGTAARNKLVRDRTTILQALGDTVQPHLDNILNLDPQAQIGIRGSLVRGTKGPHKGNAPFDPDDFDVDAFIVSDELAARFTRRQSRFRDGRNIPEINEVQSSIESSLRSNDLFSGLRKTTTTQTGNVMPDNFTFRIFTQKEIQKFQQKQDSQLFFIRENN